jgi:tetratricopeptide (TPR) repeat protein
LILGCAGKEEAAASPVAPAGPELAPLPQPDLSSLAEAVQRQIRERQRWQFRLDQIPDLPVEQRAAAQGELGNLYFAYGLVPEAEVAYVNARRLEPKNFDWAYYLCQIYGRSNRPEKAIETCRLAAALEPANVPVRVRLAELLTFQGQPEEAAKVFEEAIALDPSNGAAHSGLGQIAASAGDAKKAAEHFEQVLAFQPEATSVHGLLAQAYRDLGQAAKAEKELKKAGDGEVRLSEPLMAAVQGLAAGQQLFRQRGQQAYQEERWQDAVEAYQRAVAADPLYSDLRISLAAALLKVENPAAALEQYELALKISPNLPRAHFGAGYLFQASDRDAEAIEHYRALLAVEPKHRAGRVNLAQALFDAGRYEESKAELDVVLAEDPGNIPMRLAQLGSLVKLERYREAVILLEDGLNLASGSVPLKQALARLLATAPEAGVRNGARAVEIAEALFEEQKAPEHAETLAMAYAEAGRFDEAVKLQEALLGAAKEADRAGLAAVLEANLERYRRGERAQPPWTRPPSASAGPAASGS